MVFDRGRKKGIQRVRRAVALPDRSYYPGDVRGLVADMVRRKTSCQRIAAVLDPLLNAGLSLSLGYAAVCHHLHAKLRERQEPGTDQHQRRLADLASPGDDLLHSVPEHRKPRTVQS